MVGRYYTTFVPKEKVTLTLDAAHLDELRTLVGRRSLSAAVDQALTLYLARLKHLDAVDEWLAEMERDHGPVPTETLEWAVHVIDQWQSGSRRRSASRRAG